MITERLTVKLATDLIIRRDNKVLLSLRQNTGWMDGNYHLVGGHVEPNEVAEVSAAREAKEEVGITINPDDLKLAFVTHRISSNANDEYLTLYFEATQWTGEVENCEPDISADVNWFDITALPDNTVPYVKDLLKDYAAGKNYFSTQGEDV